MKAKEEELKKAQEKAEADAQAAADAAAKLTETIVEKEKLMNEISMQGESLAIAEEKVMSLQTAKDGLERVSPKHWSAWKTQNTLELNSRDSRNRTKRRSTNWVARLKKQQLRLEIWKQRKLTEIDRSKASIPTLLNWTKISPNWARRRKE